MNITELLQKKKEVVDEANAIRDRVYNTQNGEWRGDDEAKFDGLMTKADDFTKQIDRTAKLEAAQRSLEDNGGAGERRTEPRLNDRQENRGGGNNGGRGQATKEDRALAIHGWMATNTAADEVVTSRHLEAAQRVGIRLDQKKLRLRLAPAALDFSVLDARGKIDPVALRAWEQRLTQVDVVSPDLGGHFTVPDEMMRPLEEAMLRFGGMRQVATIIRTATGADLPEPQLNDTSNSGALLSEGGEHTDLDVQFGQLVLEAFKYTSRKVPVSVEYLQDNAINFVGRIGGILGQRLGRITNTHFTTGDGNSKPRGITVAATDSGVTTSGATAISHDNIIDLKHSVDPDYRSQGGRFMFDDTTLKILKKIKILQYSGDTTGMPLWRAGLAAGEPDTIDGDPYTINQEMPSGTGTRAMVYGLLSKYLIRDVRDIVLVRLDERYAELGIVAFFAWSRHDGDLSDAGTHPVKYLTMG